MSDVVGEIECMRSRMCICSFSLHTQYLSLSVSFVGEDKVEDVAWQ
jgi:hypothetical protein